MSRSANLTKEESVEIVALLVENINTTDRDKLTDILFEKTNGIKWRSLYSYANLFHRVLEEKQVDSNPSLILLKEVRKAVKIILAERKASEPIVTEVPTSYKKRYEAIVVDYENLFKEMAGEIKALKLELNPEPIEDESSH